MRLKAKLALTWAQPPNSLVQHWAGRRSIPKLVPIRAATGMFANLDKFLRLKINTSPFNAVRTHQVHRRRRANTCNTAHRHIRAANIISSFSLWLSAVAFPVRIALLDCYVCQEILLLLAVLARRKDGSIECRSTSFERIKEVAKNSLATRVQPA